MQTKKYNRSLGTSKAEQGIKTPRRADVLRRQQNNYRRMYSKIAHKFFPELYSNYFGDVKNVLSSLMAKKYEGNTYNPKSQPIIPKRSLIQRMTDRMFKRQAR